jgi:EmrB/QacA subfamily drug resistance transporter
VSLKARLSETPPGYTLSRGRVLGIYSGLSIALLLASIDQTVVSTVLPKIVADFGGLTEYSWTFVAYVLAATVTIPIYGKLGDSYGRRPLFLFAIGTFIASSALCGIATSMPELVVFRGMQGIGAGALWPLALATVGETVPLRERGKYNGLLGAGGVAGAIAGPLVGGFISDNTSWRWVFFMNIPLGALALVLTLATMPVTRLQRTKRPIDYTGAGVLGAATACLILGLEWGGQQYAWASPQVLGAFGACAVLAGILTVYERGVPEPILPYHLVRRGAVAACLLAGVLSSMAMYGVMSYVPLFVQAVIGSSATSAGAALMPLLLGDIVASFFNGQWISRTGRMRSNALLGAVVLTTGTILLWRMNTGTSSTFAALATFVAGLGLGLMNQIFTISVQNAVPRTEVGAATALTQSTRALGATFGVAIMGVIVNQHLPPHIGATLSSGGNVGHLSASLRLTLQHALQPAFLLAACAAALIFAVALWGVHDVALRRSVDEHPVLE